MHVLRDEEFGSSSVWSLSLHCFKRIFFCGIWFALKSTHLKVAVNHGFLDAGAAGGVIRSSRKNDSRS